MLGLVFEKWIRFPKSGSGFRKADQVFEKRISGFQKADPVFDPDLKKRIRFLKADPVFEKRISGFQKADQVFEKRIQLCQAQELNFRIHVAN